MRRYSRYGPPFGVPIPEEILDMYSDELKLAWKIFDCWFRNADMEAFLKELQTDTNNDESGNDLLFKEYRMRLIDPKTMPCDVESALKLFLDTPIPTYEDEGITGKDSCYMFYALSRMKE